MQDSQLVSLTPTLICEIIRERKTEKCWTSGAGVGCDAPQYRPPAFAHVWLEGWERGGDGISIFHPTTPHGAQVHGRAPSSGVLSTPASGRISTVALSPSAILSMPLQYNCSTGKEGRLPLLYILTFHPKSKFVVRPVSEAPHQKLI